MKYLIFSIATFFLFVMPAQADSAASYQNILKTRTISCGYVLYPPYLEKDAQTGKLFGPSYEVAEEIAKGMGFTLNWVEEVPVGGEAAALLAGRFDSICGATGTFDPNVFSQISFSNPYLFVRNEIYSRNGDDRFAKKMGMADLNKADFTFAGIEGDASLIYAKLLFPNAKLKEIPQLSDTAQMFLELEASKADLIVVEPPVAARAMKHNPDRFRKVDFTDSLPGYGMGFAFAKDAYALRDTINLGIEYVNVNDILDAVLNKHDPKGTLFIRVNKPYSER
jgi:ABC-type amino acid transport substrate-binding protein